MNAQNTADDIRMQEVALTQTAGRATKNNEGSERYLFHTNSGERRARMYQAGKRSVDILLSASFLLIFLVPLLVIALLVQLTSPGPVLFKQKRLGLNGEIFWCLKFRTMVLNAEEILRKNAELQAQFAGEFKLKNDPRITPIGQFLRKTSLDELPQFVNVLRGEMSLIGPRPIVPAELAKYGDYGAKLLTVKPGLGGLWQASGRSDVSYEERISLDMTYIDSRSLGGDIRLLLMTAASVCRSRGAY